MQKRIADEQHERAVYYQLRQEAEVPTKAYRKAEVEANFAGESDKSSLP